MPRSSRTRLPDSFPHKIAVVHDSFFIKGGAERMNIQIAKILGADMFASVFALASFDLRTMGFEGKWLNYTHDSDAACSDFFAWNGDF